MIRVKMMDGTHREEPDATDAYVWTSGVLELLNDDERVRTFGPGSWVTYDVVDEGER